jgi:hypothetical protein
MWVITPALGVLLTGLGSEAIALDYYLLGPALLISESFAWASIIFGLASIFKYKSMLGSSVLILSSLSIILFAKAILPCVYPM